DRHLELRRSAHLAGRELIGEPKGVEHDGEARVEQTVEGEHGEAHGVNDPKIVVYADSPLRLPRLVLPQARQTMAQPTRTDMKVFAIGSIVKPLSPEQRQHIMPREVPHTLKLYLDGAIEQFWFRQDKPGVVFLMNADSIEQAKSTIESLALVTE